VRTAGWLSEGGHKAPGSTQTRADGGPHSRRHACVTHPTRRADGGDPQTFKYHAHIWPGCVDGGLVGSGSDRLRRSIRARGRRARTHAVSSRCHCADGGVAPWADTPRVQSFAGLYNGRARLIRPRHRCKEPTITKCRAQRGDAVIVHTTSRTFGARFIVGRVTNITHDGNVTRFVPAGQTTAQRVDLLGRDLVKIWVLPQTLWDIDALLNTAARHVWPDSSTIRPYESLDDAKDAIARHRRITTSAA
jgi:hypothetical protein